MNRLLWRIEFSPSVKQEIINNLLGEVISDLDLSVSALQWLSSSGDEGRKEKKV